MIAKNFKQQIWVALKSWNFCVYATGMYSRHENGFSCLNRPKLLKFMTVKSYVLSISFDIGYNQNIKEYYFLWNSVPRKRKFSF